MASTSTLTANGGKKRKHSSTAAAIDEPDPIASTSTSATTDPRFTFSAQDLDSTLTSTSPKSFPKQTTLPAHLLPHSSTSNAPTPGLIYLSRIPPGMGPSKVKHLLSAYGDVGRVFLARADNPSQPPQPPSKRYKPEREKHVSHKFKEGWVEFLDKKVARSVAEMLNANTIGGKKGTKWRDDVWTMKYLPKFRWDMLSEQVALEKATQTSLLRFHLQHSKTEQEAYLSAVEKARVGEKIQQKRQTQAAGQTKKTQLEKGTEEGEEGKKKVGRTYRQREVVDVEKRFVGDGKGSESGGKSDLQGVLGKLF